MIVRKSPTLNEYDEAIMRDKEINDGTYRYYKVLVDRRDGSLVTDSAFCNRFDITQTTLARRRKILVDKGLIMVAELLNGTKVIYVTDTNTTLDEVERIWTETQDLRKRQ